MNDLGWVFIIASWGFIVVLSIFCFYRVLTEKDEKDEDNKNAGV